MIPAYLDKISETVWELPRSFRPAMRVPGRIYATEKLLEAMEEGVFEQIAHVASLPGIVNYAYCMPDGHWGYGFPIGGLAAFDTETGVISPGGIGFDINCGMRLISTSLTHEEIRPRLEELIDRLFERIPAGVGATGFLTLSKHEFRAMIESGMTWCLERGYAVPEDLECTEERGAMEGADASAVSARAIERGYNQVGTLGSGNHYLEIQVAKEENIFDPVRARAMGITRPDQVVVMLHCGSRGFGHQVASDYLKLFLEVMGPRYGITVEDRELACAPFRSPEGQAYFKAMKCAVNMAFVNRQVILHRTREVFSDVFHRSPEDLGLHQVYDVTHNTAKIETHLVDGSPKQLLVHRKGATRAFGPGMEGLPARYAAVGQPVIIGGSMETGSYLLSGLPTGSDTFFTTAHGSGRTMGRREAKRRYSGEELKQSMRDRGIYIQAVSSSGLAEEAGAAYKNIDEVAIAAEQAGISARVARLIPIGNIKG